MPETTAIVPVAAMPVMDVAMALTRYKALNSFVGSILRENTDYGPIPGTDKKNLLKPGAEKLTTFFGLYPTFEHVRVIEDWTGKDHDGEPFFYYLIKCKLWKNGVVVAEGDGSCNSRETKYRYRQGERVCPACGKATIIKGKEDYGGGWLCFGKKGGCGAKFRNGDQSIEGQQVGRILNPDIADVVNTILKMAEKRALVAATLIGVNASDYFTQDIEDLPGHSDAVIAGEYRVIPSDPTPADAAFDAIQSAVEERKATPPPAAKQAPKTNGNSGNGNKPKLAVIRTGQYAKLAPEFVKRVPYYADKNGGPDNGHILAAAPEEGFDEVTDMNIEALFAALDQRAATKVAA